MRRRVTRGLCFPTHVLVAKVIGLPAPEASERVACVVLRNLRAGVFSKFSVHI